MLTVTPAAAAAMTSLLENPELPEGASARLQRGVDAGGESAIGIAIVSGPEPDDEPVPAIEARDVYLAGDVADLLADHVLDAQVEERQVSFVLRPQSVDGRPAGT